MGLNRSKKQVPPSLYQDYDLTEWDPHYAVVLNAPFHQKDIETYQNNLASASKATSTTRTSPEPSPAMSRERDNTRTTMMIGGRKWWKALGRIASLLIVVVAIVAEFMFVLR